MRTLIATTCLTLIVLLGSAGVSWGADLQKAGDAYGSGDYAAVLRKLTPLAEQGNAPAQSGLGWMYENGRGVPQDDKAAVTWYTLAAEQGLAHAQYNLGVMYDDGAGVTQDDKTAVTWYTLAAEQGDATAQYNLGWMYTKGTGVPQDYIRAHMWANLAASSGDNFGVTLRGGLAKQMTPTDISAAQKLARECVRKNYKGC